MQFWNGKECLNLANKMACHQLFRPIGKCFPCRMPFVDWQIRQPCGMLCLSYATDCRMLLTLVLRSSLWQHWCSRQSAIALHNKINQYLSLHTIFREIWLWPGDLAQAGRFGSGREIWLSPVIQATWEARAVEWLEGLDLARTNGWCSGSALWLPILDRGHLWHGRPIDETRPVTTAHHQLSGRNVCLNL
jgi:hypothetical protein